MCIYTSEKTKTKDIVAISLEKMGLRRVAVHFPLKYVVLPEVDEFQKEGISKNISINGLCFETENRLKPSTYAMIEFKVSLKKTSTKRVKMLYQIVWSLEKNHKQLVGAKLVSSSNEIVDVLKRFLEGDTF